MSKDLLISFFGKNFFQKEFFPQMEKLYKLILEKNKSVNLTRIIQKKEFYIKHIIDSLLLLKIIPNLKGKSIIDIGCGGGFPSFILACFEKKSSIYAIDSVNKKINAVIEIAKSLDLKNLQAYHSHTTQLVQQRKDFIRAFDLVIIRAVAKANQLIQWSYKFVADDGAMIFYKTPQGIEKEKLEAERVAKKHHLKISYSSIFSLPDQSQRQFIIIRK